MAIALSSWSAMSVNAIRTMAERTDLSMEASYSIRSNRGLAAARRRHRPGPRGRPDGEGESGYSPLRVCVSIATVPWDPAQYLRFADHRLRPAAELLARVQVEAPRQVYDLGAGAGNVTALLKERWPGAAVTGVESSPAMLARARAAHPEIEWEAADLAQWQAGRPADVIYANASLHWLGDHDHHFPALVGMLAPGGVLAVQMPRNFEAPSHRLIAEAARGGPWRTLLEPRLRAAPVREPAYYFNLLAPLAAAVDVWETEYLHVLEGESPVLQWTRGTALVPLLDALPEDQRGKFEARYGELLLEAYPRRPDGRTLFPFRRLFMVARAVAAAGGT
jgi:trans-aconitate 2-methyltransferase